MPTKRVRITRNIIPEISPTALHVMSDGLYPEPEGGLHQWEMIVDNVGYPTLAYDKNKALWDSCREGILRDWIAAHPGRRPSWWWLFSAPRMSRANLERNGWAGCFYSSHLPDPRQRLSGTGTAAHDIENLVPEFSLGIPDDFRNVNASDPPKFESQAEYLRRHGLFEPGEERRLKPADFQPEAIGVECEDEEM